MRKRIIKLIEKAAYAVLHADPQQQTVRELFIFHPYHELHYTVHL